MKKTITIIELDIIFNRAISKEMAELREIEKSIKKAEALGYGHGPLDSKLKVEARIEAMHDVLATIREA